MDTKEIAMDYDIMDFGEHLVPVTVRLPEAVYFQLKELADEYKISFASVIRAALEGNLEKYLGTVKYIDREQAVNINESVRELITECREIKNNIKRIGINYNQEIRLRNAEQKYNSAICGTSPYKKFEAATEYRQELEMINVKKLCFNKEELDDFLERFEAAADKTEYLVWHIHA